MKRAVRFEGAMALVIALLLTTAAVAGAAPLPAGAADAGWKITAPVAGDTDLPVTVRLAAAASASPAPTGSVTFIDTLNGMVAHMWDVDLSASAGGSIATLSATLEAGTHWFSAQYHGDAVYPSSLVIAGAPYTTVSPIASATGVGTSVGTFYPVTDGYRDTLTISGTPLEPVSVAVVVRTKAGAQVATFERAGPDASPWSFSWNGRTGAGTLLPEGTYVVTQTLHDAGGAEGTWTKNVTLSRRYLVWHTASVMRDAKATTARTASGGAKIAASRIYGKGLSLRADHGNAAIRLAYDFWLPAAKAYGTFTFAARGTSWPTQGTPVLVLGDKQSTVGTRKDYWYSVKGGAAAVGISKAGKVRGAVLLDSITLGRYDLRGVRLSYRWASLSTTSR